MIETPTKEYWQLWEASPITIWYRSKLQEEVDKRSKVFSEGSSLSRLNMEATAQETHFEVGVMDGLRMAIAMEPEDHD